MHLQHHGIKGQKWGVRRFQNDDGTRTSTGKERYKIENRKKAQKDYAEYKAHRLRNLARPHYNDVYYRNKNRPGTKYDTIHRFQQHTEKGPKKNQYYEVYYDFLNKTAVGKKKLYSYDKEDEPLKVMDLTEDDYAKGEAYLSQYESKPIKKSRWA